MTTRFLILFCFALLAFPCGAAHPLPPNLAYYFKPPQELERDYGTYKSPLLLNNGKAIANAAEWPARRQEILEYWFSVLGRPPELVARPRYEFLDGEKRENFHQSKLRIET